jgi:Transposase DDE domain
MNRKQSVKKFFEKIVLILVKKVMHKDNYVRGEALLSSMTEKVTVVLRQLAHNFGEERGYGRFLENDKITLQDIIECYRPSLPDDIHTKHVLLVQDTTQISFGLDSRKKDLGKVGDGSHYGFFAHPVIGIDTSNGGCLGLGAVEIHKRQEYDLTESDIQAAQKSLETNAKKKGKTKPITEAAILRRARETHQHKLPFEAKDRYRWLDTALEAAEFYQDAAQLTVVGDCENDIFQVFMGLQARNVGFVIRSCQDRYLGYTGSETTLCKQSREWATQCCFKVKLPATDKRSAHEAILQVSYQAVEIACPEYLLKSELVLRGGQKISMPKSMPLYAVRVCESLDSVVNNEQPIEWLLLTSLPVETTEQALQIIQFYRWRWVIEQVFRTLKSQGLDIQRSAVQHYDGLAKLAVLALIAATQIMQLVQARDGNTNQDIKSVFDDVEIQAMELLNTQLEGKTEKQKNPHPPHSLAFAAWVIARLGGWKPFANPKPPGPITMLNGLTIFYNAMIGFRLKLEPLFQRTS